MFKKSFAIFAATLLLISSFLTLSNVKADTISPAVTQEESVTDLFSKANKYVTLKGKFFVLDKTAENLFTNSEIEKINTQISQTNKMLAETYSAENAKKIVEVNHSNNTVLIDPDNQDNYQNVEALTRSRYHQGVNSASVHWNYILIKIKKSTLNNIKNGSIGAAGYLAGKFKNIYIAIAASAIVGVLSANSIKGGMWFRVHTYVYTALEGWGWQ